MRSPSKAGLVALLAGALLAVPISVANADSYSGDELKVVGLVDGTKLVRFTSEDTDISNSRNIRGLVGDVRLVGIDYRVQDGKLYGVGNAGGVYSLSTTAQATKVTQLTIALTGTDFGVDFNPAANALRVVSDTGQNLRQPFATPNAPTIADTPLSYPPATTPAAGITGAAYTNNDLDVNTGTTLFDLDTSLDQIAVQSPANSGTLVATGKLGIDAAANAGFDIYSTLDEGSTVGLTGLATAQVNGRYSLYDISMLTGKAKRVGQFDRAVTDLSVPLDQD